MSRRPNTPCGPVPQPVTLAAGGWLCALLLLAAAMFTAASPVQAQGRPALVGVDEVTVTPVSQTFPVLGRMVARKSGIVATRVRGPVAELKVAVGDRVEAGDVIALLDVNQLRWQRELRAAEFAEKNAELETEQARLNMVNQELRRLDRLRTNRSAAFRVAQFDDKTVEAAMIGSSVAEARARVKQAEADLELVQIDLQNAQIRAPYPGVITRLHTEAGAYLSVGDPVVAMLDDADLEIEADVPVDRIAALSPGKIVNVSIDGESRQVMVRAVVPEENPLTRTRAVRLTPRFGTNGGQFAANQSATVQVPIGKSREAVTVHKDAVLNRRGGHMVFVITDGKAMPRPIVLGEAVGGRFEVREGLQAGDIVVIRGNERLRPQQPVQF